MANLRSTLGAASLALACAASPWPPSARQQAVALVAKMNLTQKISIVHGYGNHEPTNYVGFTNAIPEVGIPGINEEDGPQGVADGVTEVTSWPSALTVAMAWDPQLARAWGAAMGAEQRIKGANIMLGPGVNLARVPHGGRNFEYLGEDPVLASAIVAAEVVGIQSNNISACVKHFFGNNQEYQRGSVSANIGQRVAREMYYKPYLAAVEAGVGSAMCSYNRVNNTFACENTDTLGWLRDVAGFEGFVMSDWGATHSTIPSVLAGLDQEMPDSDFFGPTLAAVIANGTLAESVLDGMVTHILTTLFAMNIMDGSLNPAPTGSLTANASSAEHNELARVLAESSAALLKNDGGLLPLDAATVKSIAVLGDALTVHGWGSGGVFPSYVSTPYESIYALVNGVAPPARPSSTCDVSGNATFDTSASNCVDVPSQDLCQALCVADAGCDGFVYQQGRQCNGWGTQGGSCWAVAAPLVPSAATGFAAGACAPAPPGTAGRVPMTVYSGGNVTHAAALAAAADVVILSVATTCSEGDDRSDLGLPAWQDALVAAVAKANPRTVVLVRAPGALTMPWVDSVPAILYQLMPGIESGTAAARLIFGHANPSGKLPVTFPVSMNDTWLSSTPGAPMDPARYPGTDRGKGWLEADYDESLLFGYRYYDALGTSPLFEFGRGLSYSTFEYSELAVAGTVSAAGSSNATVYATLCNAAGPAGAEVAQLYVGFPAAAGEPPKLLKGFAKQWLESGACTGLRFPLTADDLSIWSLEAGTFVTLPGTYTLMLGSSSRDIRLTGSLTVTA